MKKEKVEIFGQRTEKLKLLDEVVKKSKTIQINKELLDSIKDEKSKQAFMRKLIKRLSLEFKNASHEELIEEIARIELAKDIIAATLSQVSIKTNDIPKMLDEFILKDQIFSDLDSVSKSAGARAKNGPHQRNKAIAFSEHKRMSKNKAVSAGQLFKALQFNFPDQVPPWNSSTIKDWCREFKK
jgi:hypothetical protein